MSRPVTKSPPALAQKQLPLAKPAAPAPATPSAGTAAPTRTIQKTAPVKTVFAAEPTKTAQPGDTCTHGAPHVHAKTAAPSDASRSSPSPDPKPPFAPSPATSSAPSAASPKRVAARTVPGPTSSKPTSGMTSTSASPKGSVPGSGASSPPAPPALGPRKYAATPSGTASPQGPKARHVDPASGAPTIPPPPKTRGTPPPNPAGTPPPAKAAPAAKPSGAQKPTAAAAPAKAVVKPASAAAPPSQPAAAAASPDLATGQPDVVVKGRKYVYDYVRSKWVESECQIRVLHPNRGLGQGGMRVCFEVEEILDGAKHTTRPMVAKMFRRNITHVVEKDYFNECQAQCLCEEFARNFNEMAFTPVVPHDDPKAAPVDRPHIEFVQCHIVRIPISSLPGPYKAKRTGFFSYRTEDTQAMMFAMEPKLSGFFTKYTNNFGAVYAHNEVEVSPAEDLRRRRLLRAGEAFSHFTLVETGGSMLVCDLQGVDDFLTDPQIHTEDGKGLGMGNMGQEGIDKWVEKHECNEFCEGFALQRLELGSLVRGDRKDSYFHALNARLQSQSPVRPQDLIPLPKPLEEMTEDERLDYTIRLSQLLES